MPRAKGGFKTRRRHKRLLNKTEGYYSSASRLFIHARERFDRALVFGFRDRKVRKRFFRSLWTQRINAAARSCGTTYSRFMGALNKAGIGIDRKMLADLAVKDMAAFRAIVQKVMG